MKKISKLILPNKARVMLLPTREILISNPDVFYRLCKSRT